uniref:Putative hyp8.2 culicine family member n=1 Tax=Psorophora albipes TaxID=869069 RepID=T1DFW6_9DIPT
MKFKLAPLVLLVLVLLAMDCCILGTSAAPGRKASQTIRAAKTGGAKEKQAAKAAREERRIVNEASHSIRNTARNTAAAAALMTYV